jgi:hypothetical protein
MQFVQDGLAARFPGYGTDSALPYHSLDRKMFRGFDEPPAIFAGRLLGWLDFHKLRGNPFTIMEQVQAYLTVNFDAVPVKPRIRIVNNRGTWYTLNEDGTRETVKDAGNWDWDGNTSLKSRFWLIIYPSADLWTLTPAWGAVGGPAWGDNNLSWGSTATAQQVKSVREIIEECRSATAKCSHVIIAFDSDSFDPSDPPGAAGMPDGTWGHWSVNVGGVQVPSRLRTALYWDGIN